MFFQKRKEKREQGKVKIIHVTSRASLYIATWVCRPVKLKSSSINSSDTSAKYSWPRREQNEEIQDSGVPDDEDMLPRLGAPRKTPLKLKEVAKILKSLQTNTR